MLKAVRRAGTSNLFEQVTSIDNLKLAAKKAQKNVKRKSASLKGFLANQEQKVFELQQELRNGTFKTSPYYQFKVFEPKERTVCALPFYPDRIVQHACMNILLPIWERKFTADTYNCLKGRGTHGFVRKLKKTLQNDVEGTQYALQIDIRHFYESLDHETLKKIVRWTIKDKRLLALLDEIIDSHPDGVPIGNYTSQFFATLYLTQFDHYVKRVLKAKYYFRYCDDIIILSDSKAELWRILKGIVEYLEKLKLVVKPNLRVFPTDTGIDVVGYVFYHTHTRLRKRTKLRFEQKCEKARKLGKEGVAFKCYIGSYLGLLKYADSINLKKKYLKSEYGICLMKKFNEIADEEDKAPQFYDGHNYHISDILGQTIEVLKFKNVTIHGKEKIIMQINKDGVLGYVFTGSEVLKDKINKYKDSLPFECVIEEVKNEKTGRTFYRFGNN